eukprot:CAMPEP_0113970428 /NCGR_PEP_ID=MMETSP0011_2-20120614/11177_1 /TAXON_ID=101924 /ORGANISM="Rhodosorus marinus" /LENGTH=270 /DNA_ID=CAMNT_0000984815 /DNA_START=137 /DNA_END=946 /DNA_ORIENTATION=- /assembly_acc=CAM_ASM_000156
MRSTHAKAADGNYYCPECGRCFGTRSNNLEQHWYCVHKKIKRWKCRHRCGAAFYYSVQRKQHEQQMLCRQWDNGMTDADQQNVFVENETTDAGQQNVFIDNGTTDAGQQNVFVENWTTDACQQNVFIDNGTTDAGQQNVFVENGTTDAGQQNIFIDNGTTDAGQKTVFEPIGRSDLQQYVGESEPCGGSETTDGIRRPQGKERWESIESVISARDAIAPIGNGAVAEREMLLHPVKSETDANLIREKSSPEHELPLQVLDNLIPDLEDLP